MKEQPRVEVKPSGKVYKAGSYDYGDGDRCPVEGHGNMYVVRGTNKQWCPHQSHDKERTKKDG